MTFAQKYFTVFDPCTGRINKCGRDACVSLMLACKDISPNTDFGDIENGYIKEPTVKHLALKMGLIDVIN